MAKTNRNVAAMFGGAQTAQLQTQLSQRDEEIAALKEELEALKTSADRTGVQRFPIDQFIPLQLPDGLTQPRKYFDPGGMEKLKRSIKKVGVQEPLLVRPGRDDKLEIVSGERRWRTSLELGLGDLPVISKTLSDEEALEIALVANLMREDLNIIEETDSIIALIGLRLKVGRDQLPSLLFKIKNLRTRKQLSNAEISQELSEGGENSGILSLEAIRDIDAILAEFSITLESFAANRLTALEMPDTLLSAVREGKLAFSKADVIRRANLPQEQQSHLLHEAIEQGLTKSALMATVKALKEKNKTNPQDGLREQFHQSYQQLRSKKVWQKIEAEPKLKEKFRKMQALAEELLTAVDKSNSGHQ
jgi:ParB family chromosome partitioning protein